MKYKVSLSAVHIPEETYPLMEKALRSGWIGQSEYVEQFEQLIADHVGAKHCIAVSNGTMADAVAVAAMKEMYGIKRVVVPALTFIAQPNSVKYNCLPVHFEDVGNDWLINLKKYCDENYVDGETLLFVTDLMGRIANFDDCNGYYTIEDACEAFGSFRMDGGHAGTFGEIGTFSFFPSHTISTGEGGAVVTNNADIDELCRKIRAHGAASNTPQYKFFFPYFGFNARMTTMQAVLGIAVMGHISEYIANRRKIFVLMQEAVRGFPDDPQTIVIPHAYPVQYFSKDMRDKAMEILLDNGIECRKFFSCIPVSEGQYENENTKRYPVAEQIADTFLYVPCHQHMTEQDVEYIAEVISGIGGRDEANL